MKKTILNSSAILLSAVILVSCAKSRLASAGIQETDISTNRPLPLVNNGALVTPFIDNNSVWKDTQGNEILAQGGWIVKVDNTFHWFGPQFASGSDFHFYAINHYTSTDLMTWTKQAVALAPGMSGVPMGSGSWVGRPWVVKNPNTNNFVMGIEWGSSGVTGVRNQYAFFTSSSVNGPWTYQSARLIQKMPDVNNTLYALGDMGGIYVEGNTAWLTYTFDKPQANYAQAIVKLDTDFMTPLTGAGNYTEFSGGTWPTGVQEASAIFKKGSTYYYFTSLCNGWESSVSRYRTASNMAGPWTANAIVPTNPSSSNSFDTQHDFVLPVTGTAGTTYIYCGDRWSNYTGAGTGRNGWYPLSFDASGVPAINAPSFDANGGDWTIDVTTGTWNPVAVNLLQNPGFESDFTNWTYTGNAAIATAAAEIHSGLKGFKAYLTSAYTTTLQNTVTNVAAGSYTASVFSRGDGTFSQRVLQVFVNGTKTNELAIPTSTNWTAYTISNITVPAGASVKVGIALNAAASAWTQFDDFSLTKQ